MEDSIPEIDLVGAMVPTEAKSVGRIINNDDGIKFGIRQRFFYLFYLIVVVTMMVTGTVQLKVKVIR